MNTYSITYPLVVAVVFIGLAVLPCMLAEDAVDLLQDEQPDLMELRSPTDDNIDLRYLLQNFLESREVRGWSPLRNNKQCIGDKCRYAWKRGFESPASRISSRVPWSVSQFSNQGCSGSSCLAGWKRGFRVLPNLATDEE